MLNYVRNLEKKEKLIKIDIDNLFVSFVRFLSSILLIPKAIQNNNACQKHND